MFTAAAVLKSDARDTPLTIQVQDVAALGRAGRLTAGDVVTPYELVFPLVLESSNDAATAIERVLGTSLYTSISTLLVDARLENTTIVDGSGLSPYNVSTVLHYSLAILSTLLRTYSIFRNYTGISQILPHIRITTLVELLILSGEESMAIPKKQNIHFLVPSPLVLMVVK